MVMCLLKIKITRQTLDICPLLPTPMKMNKLSDIAISNFDEIGCENGKKHIIILALKISRAKGALQEILKE